MGSWESVPATPRAGRGAGTKGGRGAGTTWGRRDSGKQGAGGTAGSSPGLGEQRQYPGPSRRFFRTLVRRGDAFLRHILTRCCVAATHFCAIMRHPPRPLTGASTNAPGQHPPTRIRLDSYEVRVRSALRPRSVRGRTDPSGVAGSARQGSVSHCGLTSCSAGPWDRGNPCRRRRDRAAGGKGLGILGAARTDEGCSTYVAFGSLPPA
jgi:hypothetical protein